MNISLLKDLLENTDSPPGKNFALFIQILILLSLVTFSIDTLPDISDELRDGIAFIEVIVILIFSVEYLLRIVIAERKLKFIFSFYGLIDLIAILPFYISTGVDLRSVRIFRFLRLFRMLKLVRYSLAIRRFALALHIAREELVLFSLVTFFLLFLSAVGIYHFEHAAQPDKFKSIFDSIWWAVSTLTTVGYGDVYPITVGGRIFTFFVLMIGLGIVAIPTGLVASALSEVRKRETSDSE
jgi:voltage-gated potassium channel